MKEILDEVLELLENGEDFALVKLIGDRGSTPRAAGAEMLVRRDGSIAGTIGGGLLELTMMREAAGVLESRRTKVVDLRLAGTDLRSEEEMVCGGSAEVLITYVAPGDPALREVVAAVKAARAARRRAWMFTLQPAGGRRRGRVLPPRVRTAAIVGARPCEPEGPAHGRRQDRRARLDHPAGRARGARRAGRGACEGGHLRGRPRRARRRAGRPCGRLRGHGARRPRGVRRPAALPGRQGRAGPVRRGAGAAEHRRKLLRRHRHARARRTTWTS